MDIAYWELNELTKVISRITLLFNKSIDLSYHGSIKVDTENGIERVDNFIVKPTISIADAEEITDGLDHVFVNKHLSNSSSTVFSICDDKETMQKYYDDCYEKSVNISLGFHYHRLRDLKVISEDTVDKIITELKKDLSEKHYTV